MSRRLHKTFQVESPDEEVLIVPFQCQINGTSNPDNLKGDAIASVVRSEAGEFLFTLRDRVPFCFYGDAQISNTADDVDLYCKVDFSTVVSDDTFVVRCMTATTQTDPTDDTILGGFLLCKKTTRRARG